MDEFFLLMRISKLGKEFIEVYSIQVNIGSTKEKVLIEDIRNFGREKASFFNKVFSPKISTRKSSFFLKDEEKKFLFLS